MIQILDYSENHICLWPIYNDIIKIDQLCSIAMQKKKKKSRRQGKEFDLTQFLKFQNQKSVWENKSVRTAS